MRTLGNVSRLKFKKSKKLKKKLKKNKKNLKKVLTLSLAL